MFVKESKKINRLPAYVFARINQLTREARFAGKDIINLGMGNPDQPTPPHIVQGLIKASLEGKNHRYSASRGVYNLRRDMCRWYKKRYDVTLDPENEVCAVIGTKEGLMHLMFAILDEGDMVMVPNPTYPIHLYGPIMAGGDIINVRCHKDVDFLEEVEKKLAETFPKPRTLIVSYPHNPTTLCAPDDFFPRLVKLAKREDLLVIHDLAYADIAFDGYRPPSFLQTPGAKEVGIEFYSLSKSFNMAGWRIGFAVGNAEVIKILARFKSYADYGIFQPIQIAAMKALQGSYECVEEISRTYQDRRDLLVDGLNKLGWPVELPRATMYLWAEIPQQFSHMGSLDFSLMLFEQAGVVVSPGIGFGEWGDNFVRIALVENEKRSKQALRNIRRVFREAGAINGME